MNLNKKGGLSLLFCLESGIVSFHAIAWKDTIFIFNCGLKTKTKRVTLNI